MTVLKSFIWAFHSVPSIYTCELSLLQSFWISFSLLAVYDDSKNCQSSWAVLVESSHSPIARTWKGWPSMSMILPSLRGSISFVPVTLSRSTVAQRLRFQVGDVASYQMSSCVTTPVRVVKVSFKGYQLDRSYVVFERRTHSRERSCRYCQHTQVFQEFGSLFYPQSG